MNIATEHTPATVGSDQDIHRKGQSHFWMMIACCIPMIAIAVALVATGVANASFLIFVAACTLMMALMHGVMGHGHNGRK